MAERERDPSGAVVFYDGECGLCARSVRWALAHDREGKLRFAPLQGSTYAALQAPGKPSDLASMVLLDGEGLHRESEAALRIASYAGGGWRLLGTLGRLVPRPVRDAAYRFVARHRQRLARGDTCSLPVAELRERFLP